MADDDSQELVDRCRTGDSFAMQQLFDRYMKRLVGLVRQRFPVWLGGRTSAESTAGEAVNDVLMGLREGKYSFQKSGDLWRLLTSIALNKLKQRIRDNTRQVRDVRREVRAATVGTDSVHGVELEMISSEPGPEQADELKELLQELMQNEGFDPVRQQIIKLALQGLGVDEIFNELVKDGCRSAKMSLVKSTLKDFEESLKDQLGRLSTIG